MSARMIKALCAVVHEEKEQRDSLGEIFESIDLLAIHDRSVVDAAVKKVGRVQAIVGAIRAELNRLTPPLSQAVYRVRAARSQSQTRPFE
jgi:hypothetical protein